MAGERYGTDLTIPNVNPLVAEDHPGLPVLCHVQRAIQTLRGPGRCRKLTAGQEGAPRAIGDQDLNATALAWCLEAGKEVEAASVAVHPGAQ